MSILKPISISLSPNTEEDDIWLAFKLLFQPWRWKVGTGCQLLEEEFKKYLGVKHAVSFNSGRSALLAILKSLNLNNGDEVLLQAFTCNAAANPIIWADLKPVYVDCDEDTFNIDVEDLQKKITERSKAVIVQHTFGLPANLAEVLNICEQNNLILIEDCAHSLGAQYRGRKIGTFGKAAFFSFSRDKIISSVYGGMVAANDDELAKRIKAFQEKIGFPSCLWVKQQLLHPILMSWKILPSYRIFGKYLLILCQWLHILSKAVHWKEKRGRMPSYFPKRLPNALAILALNQFRKLEKLNEHRRKIAQFYIDQGFISNNDPDHIYLRFTVKHIKAHQIIKEAWKKNLLIGDWYTTPIAPHDTKLEKVGYQTGSCPKAERLAKQVFNLPTHINISEKDAQKIVDFIKKYGS